ncbi:MAG: TlpA family protein disulfide reductase [Melioribacteraceae bacterium]|nr:TlpA family protein disulfide reductase [Melioribacteraceae bacterium]MCF8354077.1 TlpA family protein disulfide reductase [Melioribacteraceae bacterium]MCF8393749.1 TlpA family protein disulfide reductase [Melioribacteraceae bacterium]MCF8419493.1 TlpA family protein disulfide reductase [Melioribacteraceae bacterium]
MKVFIILFFFSLTILAQSEPTDDYVVKTLVSVGDQAPDFECKTISGENFTLSKQKGKVVLVTFFATWCSHCLAELPQIEDKIYNVFKDRNDFELIVIGRKHDSSELEKFKETKKINLPFAPDPQKEIYGKYAEKYIPRNFVIGKDGKIKLVSKSSPENRIEEIFETIKNELDKKLQ